MEAGAAEANGPPTTPIFNISRLVVAEPRTRNGDTFSAPLCLEESNSNNNDRGILVYMEMRGDGYQQIRWAERELGAIGVVLGAASNREPDLCGGGGGGGAGAGAGVGERNASAANLYRRRNSNNAVATSGPRHKRHKNSGHENDTGDSTAMIGIPVVTVKKEDGQAIEERYKSSASLADEWSLTNAVDGEPDVCAICHCQYETGDTIVTLCEHNHEMHHECASEWCAAHNTCPLCRAELPRAAAPATTADLARFAAIGEAAIANAAILANASGSNPNGVGVSNRNGAAAAEGAGAVNNAGLANPNGAAAAAPTPGTDNNNASAASN